VKGARKLALVDESVTGYEGGGTQRDRYPPEEVVAVDCPLCGRRDGRLLATEHGTLGVRECAGCSLVYTSPRVRDPERAYWGEYEDFVAEARMVLAGRAAHHREANWREELDLIERHRPAGGRLLDVGCNMGFLLSQARDRGWRVQGVEPSPALSRVARERLGLDVRTGFLEDLAAERPEPFDVVAASDVLEHVPRPREFLEVVRGLLAADGLLYVKVPNADWNRLKQGALRVLGRRPEQGVWDAYERLAHYTEPTLRAMLEAAGLRAVTVTFARPVQVPAWHRHVGAYFQHESPWALDWRRRAGRTAFHAAARLESRLRGGRVGHCAPNVVALARPA
jgi:SAM-dependent methyltransferase